MRDVAKELDAGVSNVRDKIYRVGECKFLEGVCAKRKAQVSRLRSGSPGKFL
jgi:hypothetical protein